MRLIQLDVRCPGCATAMHHVTEEDLGGYLTDVGMWCVPVLGGCGLLVADTSSDTVEDLSCAS